NTIANAERHFALGFIDFATGLPYENQADLSTADAEGYFTLEFINVSQGAGGNQFGSFRETFDPSIPDEPVPGISTVNDNYVVEFRAYLELKAGLYRFGVNSDDGFRLSIGQAPGDILGTLLGSFNGGRGSADTIFDLAIPVDGFYPVRLLWWEGGGDSNCKFFSVNLVTGVKTLINDVAHGSTIRAYRESSVVRPFVSRLLPAAGSLIVLPTADVIAEITDGTIPVDASSVAFTLNGVAVNGITKVGKVTTVRRTSSLADLLAGGLNTAVLSYSYTDGGQPTTITYTYTFTVGGSTGIVAVPASHTPGGVESPGGSIPAQPGPGGTPPAPGSQPLWYVVIPTANRVAR
ncbi:MAG: PA14 domain-containing protein, partial [Phycisphaerales bacterium]|nr:PA14 domain-containing protein [Phycisphaerales bacterium]